MLLHRLANGDVPGVIGPRPNRSPCPSPHWRRMQRLLGRSVDRHEDLPSKCGSSIQENLKVTIQTTASSVPQ